MTYNATDRGLALIAGVLATGGALAILLQDAIRTNVWQLEHGLIPVLMAVQILTAHSVVNALRSRCWGSALGFAIVAAVATWGVLYTSIGTQSTVAAETIAAAEDVNGRRTTLTKRLTANQEMLDGARLKMAKECATGQGRRCKGIAATVKVYEDAVAGNTAALANIGPAKPVAPNADKMAELLALITGATQAKIKHVLLLIEPFTYATIFELAALVSVGFAFGSTHRRAIARRDSEQSSLSAPSRKQVDNVVALFGSDQPKDGGVAAEPKPNRSPNGPKFGRLSKAEAEQYVVTELAFGRTIPSQDALARHCGRAKSTISDWLSDWERREIIPARTVRGRCKVVKRCSANAESVGTCEIAQV